MPSATLVDPPTKGFITLADAAAKFAAQGVSKDKRTICYCVAAYRPLSTSSCCTGHDNITLYDASMGGWAKTESLPIETD